jgi:hypothetical protein
MQNAAVFKEDMRRIEDRVNAGLKINKHLKRDSLKRVPTSG